MEPILDHAPFDLGLVERSLNLLDRFGQIRARKDILVVAVTLPNRQEIILTQLIIFPLDESTNGAADVCISRNLFL